MKITKKLMPRDKRRRRPRRRKRRRRIRTVTDTLWPKRGEVEEEDEAHEEQEEYLTREK
jgi:hypothetical protein